MVRFSLRGRTALITGGSRGIGRAIGLGFAEAGAGIVLVARHEDELRAARDEINGKGGNASYVVCDLTERNAVSLLKERALTRAQQIDIVVHNAGAIGGEPAHLVTDDLWDQLLELNLSAAMALTRAFAVQ